jgi:hypothetical protein
MEATERFAWATGQVEASDKRLLFSDLRDAQLEIHQGTAVSGGRDNFAGGDHQGGDRGLRFRAQLLVWSSLAASWSAGQQGFRYFSRRRTSVFRRRPAGLKLAEAEAALPQSNLLSGRRDESIAYSANSEEVPGVRRILAHIAP